jgi:calcineurin-like phosphoesterase family protein
MGDALMNDIWWTADLHFAHANILKHMPARGRQFADIEHMENCFIADINHRVKPNDTLVIAGDFCWKAARVGSFRQKLNVRNILFAFGNHDAHSATGAFSQVGHMLFPKFKGKHFHVQHYPCVSWRKMSHGGIHCYGHSHGMFEEELDRLWPYRNSIDIGIDNAYRLHGVFRPFHIDEVIERCSNAPERIDHP